MWEEQRWQFSCFAGQVSAEYAFRIGLGRTSLSGRFIFEPSSFIPPSSSARFHAPRLFSSTAISRGVRPSLSFAFTSAPHSTRRRIHTRFPRTTAQWSGVSPASSFVFASAPCFNKRSTESASP